MRTRHVWLLPAALFAVARCQNQPLFVADPIKDPADDFPKVSSGVSRNARIGAQDPFAAEKVTKIEETKEEQDYKDGEEYTDAEDTEDSAHEKDDLPAEKAFEVTFTTSTVEPFGSDESIFKSREMGAAAQSAEITTEVPKETTEAEEEDEDEEEEDEEEATTEKEMTTKEIAEEFKSLEMTTPKMPFRPMTINSLPEEKIDIPKSVEKPMTGSQSEEETIIVSAETPAPASAETTASEEASQETTIASSSSRPTHTIVWSTEMASNEMRSTETTKELENSQETPTEPSISTETMENSHETTIDPDSKTTTITVMETTSLVASRATFTIRVLSVEWLSDFTDPESGKSKKLREQLLPPLRDLFNSLVAEFVNVEVDGVEMANSGVIVKGVIYTKRAVDDPEMVATRLDEELLKREGALGEHMVDPNSILVNDVPSKSVISASGIVPGTANGGIPTSDTPLILALVLLALLAIVVVSICVIIDYSSMSSYRPSFWGYDQIGASESPFAEGYRRYEPHY
ncbi:unnamed protein product, partial [Mesorhabditis spiculigera]